MIDEFIRDVCAGKANETPKAYRSKLRQLESYLGPDCEIIDQARINAFRLHLLNRKRKWRGAKMIKGSLSKFTLRTTFSTTAFFLRWAGKKGYIPQGVELRNIREPEVDPKPIDQGTVNALLAAADDINCEWERARNLAILYVLRDTGGRVGSIARLDIDALNLQDGYATVPDKGDKISYLEFNAPTIDAIRAWLQYRPDRRPVDYLLFTSLRHTGLSRQGIYRMVARLADRAHVQGRHNPHAFRHGFAHDCLEAGADLGVVSQLLNHSSIVVTHKFYARWKRNELRKHHRRFSPGRNLPPVQLTAKP